MNVLKSILISLLIFFTPILWVQVISIILLLLLLLLLFFVSSFRHFFLQT
ncbi:MAG: hypothetical protein N7Q72_03535 [Spiroplasma sp. Tabriz.8]|nr:hypothetical protein [Spiroplasma sp. Tabriz.8]